MELNITQIERCLPENIIMEVWFTSSKSEGDITAHINESIKFIRDENSAPMVDYDSVTEEMVLGWITNTDLEERLDFEINKLKNPATSKGLPWA